MNKVGWPVPGRCSIGAVCVSVGVHSGTFGHLAAGVPLWSLPQISLCATKSCLGAPGGTGCRPTVHGLPCYPPPRRGMRLRLSFTPPHVSRMPLVIISP